MFKTYWYYRVVSKFLSRTSMMMCIVFPFPNFFVEIIKKRRSFQEVGLWITCVLAIKETQLQENTGKWWDVKRILLFEWWSLSNATRSTLSKRPSASSRFFLVFSLSLRKNYIRNTRDFCHYDSYDRMNVC